MSEDFKKALAPLVRFLVDNIGDLEAGVAAYEAWGIERLEALANGEEST